MVHHSHRKPVCNGGKTHILERYVFYLCSDNRSEQRLHGNSRRHCYIFYRMSVAVKISRKTFCKINVARVFAFHNILNARKVYIAYYKIPCSQIAVRAQHSVPIFRSRYKHRINFNRNYFCLFARSYENERAARRYRRYCSVRGHFCDFIVIDGERSVVFVKSGLFPVNRNAADDFFRTRRNRKVYNVFFKFYNCRTRIFNHFDFTFFRSVARFCVNNGFADGFRDNHPLCRHRHDFCVACRPFHAFARIGCRRQRINLVLEKFYSLFAYSQGFLPFGRRSVLIILFAGGQRYSRYRRSRKHENQTKYSDFLYILHINLRFVFPTFLKAYLYRGRILSFRVFRTF